jgi:putative hydrolase of the HAD superfamily
MKDLSRIKAILIDVDNTLIDFMKMKGRAIEAAIDAMIDAGLPLTKEKAKEEIFKIYDEKGIEYQKVFDDLLLRILGKIDFKILAAGVVAYRRIKEGYVKPYPGVVFTLTELRKRGFKLCVISDAPAFQVWTRLVGMNLHHHFDKVISFEESKVRKPHELPFKLALEELNLKPGEVLMVGDDPRRDIAGAKKLGIVTVLAKYGQVFQTDRTKPEQIPDYEINDIRELLDILPK